MDRKQKSSENKWCTPSEIGEKVDGVRRVREGELLDRWWNINTRHPANSRAPPDAFMTVMRQRQDAALK